MKTVPSAIKMLHFLFIVLLQSLIQCQGYKNVSLSNGDLCSEITKRTVKIDTDAKSGLLINEGQLRRHPLHWNHNFNCKFKVKPEGFNIFSHNREIGIYAVILSMNLRLGPYPTYECIDYIQFKRKNGTTSQKYCGNLKAPYILDPNRVAGDSKEHESMISFKDPEGELSTYINIDKVPLGLNEVTSVNIVYTAYTKCIPSGGMFPCSSEYNECIDKDYFKDGIVNCPYKGCVDEDGCKVDFPSNHFAIHTISSQVLVGSMTSLLVSFVVFACCLYMCRKYGKLCWAEDFSRPRNSPRRSAAQAGIVEATLEEAVPQTPAPTAPAVEKDLPPSYESLFPASHSTTDAR